MEIVGLTHTDGIIFVIVMALMVLDIVSGVVAAFAKNEWKSSVMRKGLLHKSSLILVLALGVIVNIGQGYLDLGVMMPVYQGLAAYIAVMEIGSIIENACKANPDLAPAQLRAIFGIKEDEDNGKNDS